MGSDEGFLPVLQKTKGVKMSKRDKRQRVTVTVYGDTRLDILTGLRRASTEVLRNKPGETIGGGDRGYCYSVEEGPPMRDCNVEIPDPDQKVLAWSEKEGFVAPVQLGDCGNGPCWFTAGNAIAFWEMWEFTHWMPLPRMT